MRMTIWISMIAVALAGAGCKKKDDATKAMDKAERSAEKAQEGATGQAKDVYREEKEAHKDEAKDQAEVTKQQGELSAAETEFAQARERYTVAAKQRLANLDAKIQQIEHKPGAQAKDAAAQLRPQRDEIARKLDAVGSQAQAGWDAFKKDVDDELDKLEKGVHDALHK